VRHFPTRAEKHKTRPKFSLRKLLSDGALQTLFLG